MAKLTEEIKSTVTANKHITHVHFDEEGNHCYHTHVCEQSGEKFRQLEPVVIKQTPSGVIINPTQKLVGKKGTQIVETVTREKVLAWDVNSVPADAPQQPTTKKK